MWLTMKDTTKLAAQATPAMVEAAKYLLYANFEFKMHDNDASAYVIDNNTALGK